MKKLDEYLNILQEEFNVRIAIEDISGDFKETWTDCYEVRCYRRYENKYEKNICKADCQIAGANKAISRLNSAKGKCTTAVDPNRCKKSIESAMKNYMNKIQQFRQAQNNSQARMKKFQAG